MGFRIKRKETVEEGVKRILEEQISKAEGELPDPNLQEAHDAIHQSRKRCKKVRALYRLIRPSAPKAYKRENARFRDASRQLSKVRDAKAMIESYDGLMKRFSDEISDRRAFASIRRRLTLRRKAIVREETDLAAKIDGYRKALEESREAIDDWSLPKGGFAAIEDGLRTTYKRGRVAMRNAIESPSDGKLHEWRKRTRYHRFHLRALRGAWPKVLGKVESEADELGELLGEDRDLAVLKDLLHAEVDSFEGGADLSTFLGLIDKRRFELQAQARCVGSRVYALKPKEFGKYLKRYWKAWR